MASFDTTRKPYTTIMGGAPQYHRVMHENLAKIAQIYESSPFNWYAGPERPELLIITCGSGWLYSWEAIKMLSLQDSVGILKLGTTWPLPGEWIMRHMMKAGKVLVVEEVDAFLENNLKVLAVDSRTGRDWIFYGKHSGHINSFGEINTDIVIRAITNILTKKDTIRDDAYRQRATEILGKYVVFRETQFCPGCPHRGFFWALKDALKLDGQEGVLTGDIGCYGSGAGLNRIQAAQDDAQHGLGYWCGQWLGQAGAVRV